MPKKKPEDDPRLKRLGAALARARERALRDQQEVEAEIGRSKNYLSSLENGKGGAPSVFVIAALADTYGVTVDSLLSGALVSKPAPAIDVPLLAHVIDALRGEVDDDQLAAASAAEYQSIVVAHSTTDARWAAVRQIEERRRLRAELGVLEPSARKRSAVRAKTGS